MRTRTHVTARTTVAASVAAALLLAGCSTKADDSSGGGGGEGEVKTDIGVTDDTHHARDSD